ncbi:MAG TPA: hypothetical protein VFQ43_19285 [Nitrososphaera sp.]|nr:hypothetical protein [Nitrososphaera sp.]
MSTGIAASPISQTWRELYKAALFETDKSKSLERIANAEMALSLRMHELFHAGSQDLQERQAVDTAISALYILRSTTVGAKDNLPNKHRNAYTARAA